MARSTDTTIRDPGIEIGPFKLLRRTDGALIIYDERLPLGARTVGGILYETIEDASRDARVFAEMEGAS